MHLIYLCIIGVKYGVVILQRHSIDVYHYAHLIQNMNLPFIFTKGPIATLYCDVPTEKAIFKGECTNVIKRSLDISNLYLSTSFFSLICVFRGKIVVEYMYCLPRIKLSLWENGTSPCTS